jgi:mevalonate kinase
LRGAEARVPLKLTLFGEHAVVYGRPAIAFTTSEFLTVRVIESSSFIIRSDRLKLTGASVDMNSLKLENPEIKRKIQYITAVLRRFHIQKPIEIEIESTVEPSVGMGTSAAVVVGTVAAISKYLELEVTKEELARTSHEVELEVQGIGSRMDTYTESLGGILYFPREGGYEVLPQRSIPVTAGYFPRTATTSDILRKVKAMIEEEPTISNQLMDIMGTITDRARQLIITEDYNRLARLMPLAHNLLGALGVTSASSDDLVSKAREVGVGCKISGGGGGGSILCSPPEEGKILLKAFGAVPVKATPTFQGVSTSFI